MPEFEWRVRVKGIFRWFRVVIVVANGLLSACGGVPSEPADYTVQSRLVGGAPVLAGAWPMVVWLDNGCTGLLLAANLVVFAAHCGANVGAVWTGDQLSVAVNDDAGTVNVDGGLGTHKIAIRSCQVNPNWQLGSSTDVGFCTLDQPAITENQIIHPALGCAQAALQAGIPATLVGFGRTGASDPPGIKRSLQATVQTVSPSLEIGDSAHGTCAGDSGSPAFVRMGSGTRGEWAVVGILSGGIEGQDCGVGYYADTSVALGWLESASGLDLSPCFGEDGAWSPSSRCTRPSIADDGTVTDESVQADELCGPSFAHEEADAALRAISKAREGCSIAVGRSRAHGLLWALALALAQLVRRRRLAHAP